MKLLCGLAVIGLLFAQSSSPVVCPSAFGQYVVQVVNPANQATCLTLDPSSFVVSGNVILIRSPQFIDAEVPKGTIDGANRSFKLAAVPFPITSLHVFVDGLRMRSASDYTFTGATIVFALGAQPQPGDTLLVDYSR